MLQRSLAHSFVVVALLAAALFIVLTTSVRAADANVVCVQRELNALGHGAGTPDGQIGPKTRAAARAFLEITGSSQGLPDLSLETAKIWCEAVSKKSEDARVERIKSAFSRWAVDNSVKNASLAITINGMLGGTASHGDYSPFRAAPIASLSKAITGVCIAKLVESGVLQFDTEIGTLLPDYFGPSTSKRSPAERITVRQLLTHTSGITNDLSQGLALYQFSPFSVASNQQAVEALTAPLGSVEYSYNNMNYALLGAIIEAIADETYEEYCGRKVLEAIGVQDAELNPEWRVMGAYGGWKISTTDFAKFLIYFDPVRTPLSLAPAGWPRAKLKGGASYSLGTFMRKAGSSYNFWHFGSWLRYQPYASFGAYFALWGGNIGVVVNYAPTISDKVAGELDAALSAAALQ